MSQEQEEGVEPVKQAVNVADDDDNLDNKRKDKGYESVKSSGKPRLASAECMLEPASQWKS